MIKSEFHVQIVVDGVAAQILQNNREIERKLQDIMQIKISMFGVPPSDGLQTINTNNLLIEHQQTSPFRQIPQITFRSISPYSELSEAQRIESLMNVCITEYLEGFLEQLVRYLRDGIRTK